MFDINLRYSTHLLWLWWWLLFVARFSIQLDQFQLNSISFWATLYKELKYNTLDLRPVLTCVVNLRWPVLTCVWPTCEIIACNNCIFFQKKTQQQQNITKTTQKKRFNKKTYVCLCVLGSAAMLNLHPPNNHPLAHLPLLPLLLFLFWPLYFFLHMWPGNVMITMTLFDHLGPSRVSFWFSFWNEIHIIGHFLFG